MKNKILGFFLSLCLFIPCAFMLTACGNNDNSYTVTFEVNGGSSLTQIHDTKITTEPFTEKEQHNFIGWYDNESFTGNKISFPYDITQNITFFAKWDIIESQGLAYEIDNQNAKITGIGTCQDLIIAIPEKINDLKVTSIGNSAFKNTTSIVSAIFTKSIYCTTINEESFYGCVRLSSVILTDNITTISDSAFRGCSKLKNINLPNSITSIGNNAFNDCDALSSVAIPNKITIINNTTFYSCSNLTSVTIPSSVLSIEDSAFGYCSALSNINIPYSVTNIKNRAFYHCNYLTTITLPNSILSIGNEAFAECESLTSINIPTNITRIENQTFEGCSALTSITIPDNVQYIGNSAFANCESLKNINIPSNVTSIGNSAFSQCENLISISIPNNVESIGLSAFYNCDKLKSINLPFVGATKNDISNYHFGYIFGSALSVNNSNYVPSSLKSVTIASGNIDVEAFAGCNNITQIVLLDNVSTIYSKAFLDCTDLSIYSKKPSQPSSWENDWNYSNCPTYWYSSTQPSTSGNFWHYVDNEVTNW